MAKKNILEKFHSKRINVIVKLLVNALFIVGFFLLLFFLYKDGKFNEWICQLIIMAGIIFLGIYLNKSSLTRSKKTIISVLVLVVFILLLNGFYKKIFIKTGVGSETWNIGPFLTTLFIFIRIFSNKVINSIFQFSLKIDENMNSLPKNIEGKKNVSSV